MENDQIKKQLATTAISNDEPLSDDLLTDNFKTSKSLQLRRLIHKKNKLCRKFKIKVLVKKSKKKPQLYQSDVIITRFLNYAIPIEPTYADPIYSKSKYLHPIFSKINCFKRISSIIHNLNNNEYEYKIEERKSDRNFKTKDHWISRDLIKFTQLSKYEYSNQLS